MMLRLSDFSNRVLSQDCLLQLDDTLGAPPSDLMERRCEGLLSSLPPLYKKCFIRTLIPMMGQMCGDMSSEKKEKVKYGVVNVVMMCVAVDNKLCCTEGWIREWSPCDCATQLGSDFSWCMADIAERSATLPKIYSLHLMGDGHRYVLPVLLKKSIESLQLISLGAISIPLINVKNVTEIYIVATSLSVDTANKLKMLTKLKTLYLDFANVPAVSAGEMVCKSVLPHLYKFYWDDDPSDNMNDSFATVVSHCTCPCSIQCLQRLRWMYPLIYLRRSNMNDKLLGALGLVNVGEVMAHIELLGDGITEKANYSKGDITVKANFSLVEEISCDAVMMYKMLESQPHLHVTEISTYSYDMRSPDYKLHLRDVLNLAVESSRVHVYHYTDDDDDDDELLDEFLSLITESRVNMVRVGVRGETSHTVTSLNERYSSLSLSLVNWVNNGSEIRDDLV